MADFDGECLGKALKNLKVALACGKCLHPLAPQQCNGKPIGSHTIQRSRVLDAIAMEGHVLSIRSDQSANMEFESARQSGEYNSLSALRAAGALIPKRIGIRKASVFPGFCGKHDHDTFAPIEEQKLVFNDGQCFLFTYRPACMELWAQQAKVFMIATALNQDNAYDAFGDFPEGIDIGLDEHFQRKIELDAILQSASFSEMHTLVLYMDTNIGVATAGVFAPEVDFADCQLQDIKDNDTPLQRVSYSIVPFSTGSHVIIGWFGQSVIAEQFVDSLLSLTERERSDAILRVAFESLENTYFSPVWWQGLEDHQKEWVGFRANTGGLQIRPVSYKPDDICISNFGTSIIKRN